MSKGLKCLNPKCNYDKLTNYDCTCPKCHVDQYYLYHYRLPMGNK